ncbi:NAD(P)-dependent oxidoreductase [Asticcacaulis excentricus]|uniref:Phosphogluconate dehydrogenase, NAD-binding, putative-like protein n=1 Tax=Asticcacaulis excentricus (strain ATCC 15261 / DSM 4724 / KCTC 12464 / NCIMB 9791 / VKM B-1370 / CB 48) TaxID=573065 RepID=E8RUH3_ASTEC|nr:DUF1932 domain-containing protein [Asticcacaulis excentricus]ADU14061.1 Phosphogluconate dehydrogenase, NAD-binding, putative-like protein [Asticcacaulis excentricus CB 48]
MSVKTILFLGFGEVGQALAAALQVRADLTLKTFDLNLADASSAVARAAARLEIVRCRTAVEAAHGADLIISAVTAAQTISAAQSLTGGLKRGAIYLDLNSAAPGTKFEAALAIEGTGGRFIEASVMSPIYPQTIAAPILLSGRHARDVLPVLQGLGFTGAKFCSDSWGRASATKLCRSVMIKGLEALITESLLAARFHGVEDEVLASLNNLFPHPDWPGYARYMISRTLEHGTRRAEEMFEAVKTVEQAGLSALMARATAHRQAEMPAFASALREADLIRMLDAIRAQLTQEEAAQ